MKIALIALAVLSPIVFSAPRAWAQFNDTCVYAAELKSLPADRQLLLEQIKETCEPIDAKELEKAPECERTPSQLTLKPCRPLCTTRHPGAGSGQYFRVFSADGENCMENRRIASGSGNLRGEADAYLDLMLDQYKSKLQEKLRLFTSRLERLVTSPDSVDLQMGGRPAREAFGEILASAKGFSDEINWLSEAGRLDGEHVRAAQMHHSLLFTGCRTPIKRDIDKCDGAFQLYSLDDLESGLRELEAAYPTTTIVGKLVFGVRSARKELLKDSDELGFVINELTTAIKCRDLRMELGSIQARAGLPVCGRQANCPKPAPPSAVLAKPAANAVITIPTVLFSIPKGEWSRETPKATKAKGSAKPTALPALPSAQRQPTRAEVKALQDAQLKAVMKDSDWSSDGPKRKPTPKTGDAEMDRAQEALDKAYEALEYTL